MASLLLTEVAQQQGLRCPWKAAASHIRVHGLLDRDAASGLKAKGQGGITIMKVKVGGSTVEKDIQRVNELVSSMPSGTIRLRLDANQAWSLEEVSRPDETGLVLAHTCIHTQLTFVGYRGL